MATLNSVIVPAKVLKGGRHKVRISVAHNGETRYIVTDIIIDSAKEFKNGQVIKRPDASIKNTKIRALLQKYQTAIDELGYIEGLTCPELIYHIQTLEADKHRTITSVFNEYIKVRRLKHSTIYEYQSWLKFFIQYCGSDISLERITQTTILNYEKHMIQTLKIAPDTIRARIIFLKAMLNYAHNCNYITFKINPFHNYKLPNKRIRESWLDISEIKRIRDLTTTKSNINICRDIFMLSYYLGGINIVDLYKINFNECKKTICYTRTKTENHNKINKYIEFDIPEEAIIIINRYKNEDGFLRVSNKDTTSLLQYFLSYNTKIIQKKLNIKYMNYYSARKSFSQHAFDLGISTSIIDYILGHSLGSRNSSLYHYISVTPKMATDAIRKVLDNLK